MPPSSGRDRNSGRVSLSTQAEPSWRLPRISEDGRSRSRPWKHLQICEVMGEFEQIAGKRHASRQRRWIQFGVLGLAAEVEVGKHAPSFQGLNLLFDCVFDLVADLQELIARCGSIGEVHHEEYGGLSDPIVPQRGNDADHVWGEALLGSRYCRLESCLLGKRPWNVHSSIMARSGKSGLTPSFGACAASRTSRPVRRLPDLRRPRTRVPGSVPRSGCL